LMSINYLFLTKYKLTIDNMEIIPIETEIYYYDKDNFADEMTHKNKDQKDRFGKLYFHNKPGYRAGVDICISEGDYFLSILLRSAIIKKKSESYFVFGPNKLRRQFYDDKLPNNAIALLKEKTKILSKRNDDIDTTNIHFQERIKGKMYANDGYLLNCLNLGKKIDGEKDYEHLKKIKQNFYSSNMKEKIKQDFE
ncbi:MAG: hypothetical protein K6E94_05215, partial [Elusimicrobiaceae bacterium]|nr:hypothetical protein [Elusimicrobiaceae bacterium]